MVNSNKKTTCKNHLQVQLNIHASHTRTRVIAKIQTFTYAHITHAHTRVRQKNDFFFSRTVKA